MMHVECALIQGRSQDFFSTEAKETSAKGPMSGARRDESGGGVLGERQPAPPRQVGVSGSAVSCPGESEAESRPPNGFHAF